MRSKINNLEKKVICFEENGNLLEQYGRRNDLKVKGVPDNVEDEKREDEVIEILQETEVNVSTQDIEACHRVQKGNFLNRKKFKNIDRSSIGLTNSNKIFINENLTPTNSKLAFHCRKLKRDGHIE